jgi:hypothetical protein
MQQSADTQMQWERAWVVFKSRGQYVMIRETSAEKPAYHVTAFIWDRYIFPRWISMGWFPSLDQARQAAQVRFAGLS